jgi:hypothetical protein
VPTINPRIRVLIFAGAAIVALVLLSASLNSLEMSAGQNLSFEQISPKLFDPNISSIGMRWLIALFRLIMILCWIALPFYIFMLFKSKEERKRFIRNMLLLALFFLLLYFFVNEGFDKKLTQFGQGVLGTPKPGEAVASVQLLGYVPPPQWVTTLTTIIIALVIALIAVGFVYFIWRQARNRKQLKEPLRNIEKEAKAALDAIVGGADLRETIVRCYLQMIEALQVYRGINREKDITPHEFEQILEQRGMPSEPVQHLTKLFEDVRYGTFNPGRKDEQIAISSLTAIINACQRVTEGRN